MRRGSVSNGFLRWDPCSSSLGLRERIDDAVFFRNDTSPQSSSGGRGYTSHETKGQENHFWKVPKKDEHETHHSRVLPLLAGGSGPFRRLRSCPGLSCGWLETPSRAGPDAPAASAASQNSEPRPWGSGLSLHEASFKFQVFSFKFLCALIHLSLGQTYT